MYRELEYEIATFERRTPSSQTAHQRALPFLPLGVASNFRSYEPYPVFVKAAQGGHFRDLDNNDYVDYNLCFGALMAGHCHPAVVRAVEEQLHLGTMYGMPHELERELAEEIVKRFPVEQVRFANSGTEATMHAIRLARGFTGRDKIVKFEGCYHGVHDAVMVSVKPKGPQIGDVHAPNPIPVGGGIPEGTWRETLPATFNDVASVERWFRRYPDEIAALIVEPIPMNLGICMPQPGFLEALRELCSKHGALYIFDEVKTGAKLGPSGACGYFNIKPDIICLAKSIGGGFPLAVFGASKKIMDTIAEGKVFHAGTYNTNPVVMAAGIATFRHVLTAENYKKIARLRERLVAGYNRVLAKSGLQAYVMSVGANGALMLYSREIRNYRDWKEVDVDLWSHYWFGMVNRGVMPQPYWWDEQWTISVAHTEQDIDKHIAAFENLAPALAKAQQERMAVPVG
jgi:glutamate-1-semialdehyde 2,1-aminomutase